jgi:hypothetical protein
MSLVTEIVFTEADHIFGEYSDLFKEINGFRPRGWFTPEQRQDVAFLKAEYQHLLESHFTLCDDGIWRRTDELHITEQMWAWIHAEDDREIHEWNERAYEMVCARTETQEEYLYRVQEEMEA